MTHSNPLKVEASTARAMGEGRPAASQGLPDSAVNLTCSLPTCRDSKVRRGVGRPCATKRPSRGCSSVGLLAGAASSPRLVSRHTAAPGEQSRPPRVRHEGAAPAGLGLEGEPRCGRLTRAWEESLARRGGRSAGRHAAGAAGGHQAAWNLPLARSATLTNDLRTFARRWQDATGGREGRMGNTALSDYKERL